MICMLTACRKEHVSQNLEQPKTPFPITLTMEDAKAYLSDLPESSTQTLAGTGVDWAKARAEAEGKGNKWVIRLEGQPRYQNYKQGYRELVMLRDHKTGIIEARILEIIPDAIYLQRNRKITAKTFTGRVFEYSLDYRLLGGRLFGDGKQVGIIKAIFSNEHRNLTEKLGQSKPLHIGIQGKIMTIIETCIWAQESYVDAQGELTIHATEICSEIYFDDGAGYYGGIGGGGSSDAPSPGEGGGGGGGTSNPSPPPPSNLPGEDKNTVDPKEMMACFSKISSPNAAFVVRVYVIEPLPGTSFNVGQNSFGHVAISLSKTSGGTTITQTIGFYPTGTGLGKLSSKSRIVDNGDFEYNIGATYYVNEENFQKVINFIGSPPENYHFADYNCAAFVYQAGQAGGIPIPDPTTQIGLGGAGGSGFARTPAGMASALRDQKANNPTSDINEAGGRIPGSNGPCK